MWCLGLPVCRWQRVEGNPKISMPLWGWGLGSALFGGEDTICFTGGSGSNVGARGFEVFSAAKIAAEVRGHTLRVCVV